MSEPTDYAPLMKRALEEIRSLRAELASRREAVAIVGMACRFPGRADTPDKFWELLRDGRDAIEEVPRVRWDVDRFYDADPDAPGKMYTRHGGWLEDVDRFDAQFFGVSPLDALNMDPQQRLLLEVAWEALEHAGQVPGEVPKTGVYVGSFMDDYLQLNFEAADRRDIDAYNTLGLLRGLAAGRLAYALDLHGPAMQLDTACSSSLLAAHLAVQGLRNRECDLALAGGVNLILAPEVTIGLCRMKAMAADGRCKTFDARADGYVRGEGCGMVVLKRLSDAIADGDSIYAVIRGSAVNHDGRSNGLTAPNGTAQKTLIRDALLDAGVEPSDIQLIEAHGTGTSLGDPIEAIALGEVLCQGRSAPLFVGSVKSNFGHLESAAGVAAIMKTALALHHGAIPPSLHFEQPNPHIPWERLPLSVPTALTPWPADKKRIAGISSFGMSGTNVHMVLEESPPPITTVSTGAHVITLSAASEEALKELAGKYASVQGDLADIAYTSNRGRRQFDHRLAIVASSLEDLERRPLAGGTRAAGAPRGRRPRVAFLFPGQGTDVRPANGHGIQASLFVWQIELAKKWISWGVTPDAVLGHSVGEYAAACIAGVFGVDDGLRLLSARERLMNALPERGTMAAIFAGESRVREAIAGRDVSIAALNGTHVVISGRVADVQAVAESFADARPLDVVHAFHSSLMDPMLDAFEREVARTPLRAPQIAFASTIGADPTHADYWRRHVREPVRFADAVRGLRETILVEIGPKATLLGMAASERPDATLLRSDRMLESAAALWELGVDVDWVAAQGRGRKVALPTYPFQRSSYWISRTRDTASEGCRRITADTYEHRLDGKPIVPAAAYLSMLLTEPCTLRDVVFPAALTFPADEERTLHVAIEKEFRFASLAGETYCTGSVERRPPPAAEQKPAAEAAAAPQNLEDDAGFEIGPSFRRTRSVRRGDGEVLCEMEPGDFDPGLIDSCLRTLSLCRESNDLYAPFRIERVVFHAKPHGALQCHARATEIAADHIRGDVTLFADGKVVLEVIGLEARKLQARDEIVHVEWIPTEVNPSSEEHVVFRCEGDNAGPRLLTLLRELERRDTPPRLWVVTRNAQPVLADDDVDPTHAWVWGFGRAVAAEQPRLRWTSLDVDSAVDGGDFTPCDTDETQLAFRNGNAYAARLVRKSIAAPPARALFRADATYLVTGAFGALGTRVAKWMVEEGAKQLILTGRNPAPTDIEGARVIAGDIADPAFVEQLFASADIKGVIHCAGVVDDALLGDLTWDRVERVFAPKVAGTINLDRHAAGVEFFVCFSSAASILGSRGQAAYAGANAFMDALVHQRRRRGLPALAINWGAWGESGMAARLEIRKHHESMGIVPIDPREGLEILGRLMRGDTVQAGVIRADWSKLLPSRVEPAPRATVPTDRASLESHIRLRIVEVMGRDPFPGAENDLSFFELGMDSLMSLDLRNRLQSDFDRALPSIIAFDYPSIPELAGYLLDTLSTAKDLVHAT